MPGFSRKKERKKERQLADFLTSLEQAGYTAKAVACCWAGAVMQTFGFNIENVETINRGTNGPTGWLTKTYIIACMRLKKIMDRCWDNRVFCRVHVTTVCRLVSLSVCNHFAFYTLFDTFYLHARDSIVHYVGRSVGRSVCLSVCNHFAFYSFFDTIGQYCSAVFPALFTTIGHNCSCPIARDCSAVYPALLTRFLGGKR